MCVCLVVLCRCGWTPRSQGKRWRLWAQDTYHWKRSVPELEEEEEEEAARVSRCQVESTEYTRDEMNG